jgi:hypothetical protein
MRFRQNGQTGLPRPNIFHTAIRIRKITRTPRRVNISAIPKEGMIPHGRHYNAGEAVAIIPLRATRIEVSRNQNALSRRLVLCNATQQRLSQDKAHS